MRFEGRHKKDEDDASLVPKDEQTVKNEIF